MTDKRARFLDLLQIEGVELQRLATVYARYQGLPAAEAPDVYQEAMQRTWRRWDEWSGREAGWRSRTVKKVLANVAAEMGRKQRNQLRAVRRLQPIPATNPERYIEGRQALAIVQEVYAQLSERNQLIFSLAAAGMSGAEVAEQAETSETNVRTVLNRVRNTIRHAIEQGGVA